MNFYNIVTECSGNFSDINGKLISNFDNLKTSWEGSAALKFFTKVDEIKEILSVLKTHFSLYEAAGVQIKVLEELIENLDIKLLKQSELEEPNLSLATQIKALKKQKKELIKEIEEYFDTISRLNAGSMLIDFRLFINKNTIEKAEKVNNITSKETVSKEKSVIDEETSSSKSTVVKSIGDKIVDKADEIHQYMEANNYTYCVYGGNSYEECDDYGKSHGLNKTFEESKKGYHNTCCATYVSWVLQEAGLISRDEHSDGANNLANTLKNKGWSKVSANELQPGDVMVFNNHVQIYGDNAEIYNAGSGNSIRGDVTENSGRKNCSYGLRAPK